jgi:hypothetical protein
MHRVLMDTEGASQPLFELGFRVIKCREGIEINHFSTGSINV